MRNCKMSAIFREAAQGNLYRFDCTRTVLHPESSLTYGCLQLGQFRTTASVIASAARATWLSVCFFAFSYS